MKKSPGIWWKSFCIISSRISSIVFVMIGLSASDAGLQFSLRYALVDSSANEKEEKENFHMQKLIIKVNRHIGVKKKHFTDDD